MRLFLSCFVGAWPLVCLASPLSNTGTQDIITSVSSVAGVTFATPGDIATQTATIKGVPYVIPFRVSVTSLTATTTTAMATQSPKASWKPPSLFNDLTLFGVTNFPVGRENFAIVASIPASATSGFSDFQKAANNTTAIDNTTSILQVLYPAHSINPRRKPQGGAEFYAIPLNISQAQNVTLCYSVFFPQDFDWVLAGKLPGLYGGHPGCSGGNQARDCFSTRLMWRQGGVGELYLYAPRDKQTEALCTDPRSVCDSTYGISIGRGAFNWSAGRWTTICQTVSLNTPGNQDGSFTLDVDYLRVIDRRDVFYRDLVPLERPGECLEVGERYSTSTLGDDTSLVSRLFWQLVNGVASLVHWPYDVQSSPKHTHFIRLAAPTLTVTRTDSPIILSSTPAETSSIIPTPTIEHTVPLVGFVGLFFSTFFGGHEDQYATPRDQFAWFKDFQITYNS